MATKSKQSLFNEIDAAITSNGTGAITGPILNTVLKSLTGSLAGGYYSYPKDLSLTSADIGKVVMNDGSGTAKVYQLSPAVPEQLGRWIIHLENLSDTTNDSYIEISSDTYYVFITRTMWRDGNIPADAEQEMELIQNYIESDTNLSFLSLSLTGGQLTIEENTYSATRIRVYDFEDDTYYVDVAPHGPLPAAPTAFPLGKLVGLESDTALISNSFVETYLTDGTITLNNNLYNNNTQIDTSNLETLLETYQTLVIVPTSNGKVKSFDVHDLTFDDTLLASIRQHFIGIAVAADANSVTVVNANYASLIINLLAKIYAKRMKD